MNEFLKTSSQEFMKLLIS